jgi:chromosome segregation ATPase
MNFLRFRRSARQPPQPAVGGVPAEAVLDHATELRIRNTELDAQVKALKKILETERARSAELKAERDRWAAALETTQRYISQISAREAEMETRPAARSGRSPH